MLEIWDRVSWIKCRIYIAIKYFDCISKTYCCHKSIFNWFQPRSSNSVRYFCRTCLMCAIARTTITKKVTSTNRILKKMIVLSHVSWGYLRFGKMTAQITMSLTKWRKVQNMPAQKLLGLSWLSSVLFPFLLTQHCISISRPCTPIDPTTAITLRLTITSLLIQLKLGFMMFKVMTPTINEIAISITEAMIWMHIFLWVFGLCFRFFDTLNKERSMSFELVSHF